MGSADSRRLSSLAVAREFVDAIAARDRDRFLALWRDDATWEFPFRRQPGGRMDGKAEVEAFVDRFLATFNRVAFQEVQLYPALDPDLVFATYRGDMEVSATGRPYRNTYIAVFRLRDGCLACVSEFFNPDVVAEAFGE